MLDALSFVRGATATKDFVPVLKHFYMAQGVIQGSNGKMTLSAPIDGVPECCPDGNTFLKAISACSGKPEFNLTPTGKLRIKAGKFSALVNTLTIDKYYLTEPEGDTIILAPGLLEAIRLLHPFIGTDASRQWSTGILFRHGKLFATNNIMVAEAAYATNLPEVCLPVAVLDELLRIGEAPESFSATANNITFHFSDGRWVKSQLLPIEWPDIESIIEQAPEAVDEIPDGFFTALTTLRPFADDMLGVTSGPDGLSVGSGDTGATIHFDANLGECFAHLDMLMRLQNATHLDLGQYPGKIPFRGPGFKGVMMGMRR